METIRKYEWDEIKWAELNIGDTIRLPEFTVPETTIAGDRELFFREQTVKDTATVYNIKNGKVYLVFDHALFQSAMDLNNATDWKNTQLHNYLNGAFKNSMQGSSISVSEVSLLSIDELFGKKALPFFKDGRNRIAFNDDDSTTVCYWLKNTASAACFRGANYYGLATYYDASRLNTFVRPCFVVKKEE